MVDYKYNIRESWMTYKDVVEVTNLNYLKPDEPYTEKARDEFITQAQDYFEPIFGRATPAIFADRNAVEDFDQDGFLDINLDYINQYFDPQEPNSVSPVNRNWASAAIFVSQDLPFLNGGTLKFSELFRDVFAPSQLAPVFSFERHDINAAINYFRDTYSQKEVFTEKDLNQLTSDLTKYFNWVAVHVGGDNDVNDAISFDVNNGYSIFSKDSKGLARIDCKVYTEIAEIILREIVDSQGEPLFSEFVPIDGISQRGFSGHRMLGATLRTPVATSNGTDHFKALIINNNNVGYVWDRPDYDSYQYAAEEYNGGVFKLSEGLTAVHLSNSPRSVELFGPTDSILEKITNLQQRAAAHIPNDFVLKNSAPLDLDLWNVEHYKSKELFAFILRGLSAQSKVDRASDGSLQNSSGTDLPEDASMYPDFYDLNKDYINPVAKILINLHASYGSQKILELVQSALQDQPADIRLLLIQYSLEATLLSSELTPTPHAVGGELPIEHLVSLQKAIQRASAADLVAVFFDTEDALLPLIDTPQGLQYLDLVGAVCGEPKKLSRLYLEVGRLLNKQGDDQKAFEYFKRSIVAAPPRSKELADSLYELILITPKENQENILKQYRANLGQSPHDKKQLAAVYLSLGHYDDAWALLEPLVTRAPKDETLRLMKIDCWLGMDRDIDATDKEFRMYENFLYKKYTQKDSLGYVGGKKPFDDERLAQHLIDLAFVLEKHGWRIQADEVKFLAVNLDPALAEVLTPPERRQPNDWKDDLVVCYSKDHFSRCQISDLIKELETQTLDDKTKNAILLSMWMRRNEGISDIDLIRFFKLGESFTWDVTTTPTMQVAADEKSYTINGPHPNLRWYVQILDAAVSRRPARIIPELGAFAMRMRLEGVGETIQNNIVDWTSEVLGREVTQASPKKLGSPYLFNYFNFYNQWIAAGNKPGASGI